ncbi:hypothetical protein MCEME31_00349 [Candidatus Pelagibacterales bacterium]|jgi:hypothetical protein
MDKKQETYLIPEKGPEGSLTGRTIVYRPGEWSERYNLLKASAEDDPERKRSFIDIELKSLKRDQAIWNEEKKGYFDAIGKKYNYSQMMKQNQYVRAKANTITDDVSLINKFMQRKTHDWISKWEQDFENDYGYSYAPKDNDNVAKKELIKQKSIEKLKVMNKEKEEIIKQENEVIMPKIPEKTVTEIVKEMSEKRHQDQIKHYEKEFGRGGIAELMRPL